MFYEVEIPQQKTGQKKVSALVVLNPAESRRLLAKATVALPEVHQRLCYRGVLWHISGAQGWPDRGHGLRWDHQWQLRPSPLHLARHKTGESGGRRRLER